MSSSFSNCPNPPFLSDTLPQLILEARKAQGLSQQQLADKAGLSRATIKRYERGDTPRMRLYEAECILQALGRSLQAPSLTQESQAQSVIDKAKALQLALNELFD